MKFLKKFKSLIEKIEQLDISLAWFLLTFFFVVSIRNLLEVFSAQASMKASLFIHYYFFWSVLFSALTLFFYLITKEKIIDVVKIVSSAFVIVNIAPLIDLILSPEGRHIIAFLMPSKHGNLLARFLTFFGEFSGTGITPGMRVEIVLVLMGVFSYFLVKKEDFIKSLLATLGTYAIIFCFLSTPYFLKFFLEGIGLKHHYQNWLYIDFYLILFFVLSFLLFHLSRKEYSKAILKDIRLLRLIHFEMMFITGLLLAFSNTNFVLQTRNFFEILLILISIVQAWLASVVFNNIADIEIDSVSNPGRPLITKSIPSNSYRKLGVISGLSALVCSGAVSFKAFFLTLIFIGGYFLYSIPPLRLKRVPFLSKLIIAGNSSVLIMLGFIVGGEAITNLPLSVITITLLGVTLAANFIDIKDYKGDKKEGIRTLPVILGLKKAKIVIGLFFWLAYLSVYFISPVLAIPGFFLGMLQFFLINKKDYKEWPVFAVYLLSVTGLGVWWLL